MNKRAYTQYNSMGIKQKYTISSDDVHESKYSYINRAVVVAINKKGELRVRHPNAKGNRLETKYLKKASQDLQCMAAMLISGLLSPGIFADKLQEEFPQYEEVANLLREWEQTKNNNGN